MAVSPTVRINVSGARGARGAASGPLADGTVGAEEIKNDPTALEALRDKIDPAKGIFSRAAYKDDAGRIGGKLAHEIADDDLDYVGDPQAAIDEALGRDVYLAGVNTVAPIDNPLGSKFRGPGRMVRTATQGGIYQDPQQTYTREMGASFNKMALYRLFARIRAGGTLKMFLFGDSTMARGQSSVTGSISGTDLTVTDAGAATLNVGTALTNVAPNTVITAMGSGTGGTGTYVVSTPQTVASSTINTSNGGGYAGGNGEPQLLMQRMLGGPGGKGVRNPISITNRAIGGTKWSDLNAIPDIDTVDGKTDVVIIKYCINDPRSESGDLEGGLAALASTIDTKLSAIRASSGYAKPDNLTIILVGPTNTFDPEHGRTNIWYERCRDVLISAAIKYTCFYFDPYTLMPGDIGWIAGKTAGFDDIGSGQAIHPGEIPQSMWLGALVDEMIGFSDLSIWDSNSLQALTLENSWTNYGSNFGPATYSMDRNGVVSVYGQIVPGALTAGTTLFTLPIGFRPFVYFTFSCAVAGGGQVNVRVLSTGEVQLHDTISSVSWLSLSGIGFPSR